MCIHLHHSDTHPDQVSYFMGEFRLTVIFNQPGFGVINLAKSSCLSLSCKIIITPSTDAYDQKLNFCSIYL